MQENSWDVIIAGAGPAGLSAALMLGRARRRVLVIDAGSPRNRFAAHLHGVLGQEGVPPAELLARGRAEAASYGVELIDGAIERVESEVDGDQRGLQITTADGAVRSARALIVATGLSDELPEIPGLAERWGSSVLNCPYCHGWEVRDQHLGVLTTSPFGLHQAELIRQWSDRVTVFTHGLGPITAETEQRLRARGLELEPAPVVEILGEGTEIAAVRLDDGRQVPVDAIFTAGVLRPHDDFLAPLDLARNETPFGSFLAVDPFGRTGNDRIWAIGNVVNPGANVPISIGAGAFTGGAVNGALVGWDFDAAVQESAAAQNASVWPEIAPVDYWEERYAGADRVWSGKVNQVLAETARTLSPGSALDLGCGEGADAIWLAQHGWDAAGVDISSTAIGRATAAAEAAGLGPEQIRFAAADLATVPAGTYDLVSASFLHSMVELPRTDILRQAAGSVRSGGHLLITSHADFPPWVEVSHGHEHRFLSPEEEIEQLALAPDEWDIIIAQTRTRQASTPDGEPATLDDVVVLLRRR